MKRACLVCGESGFDALYDNLLLQCGSCGFITANREVSAEALKEIYTGNYFEGGEYASYLADKPMLQKNFRKRLEVIYRHIDKKEINNALEIGCAYGFFAETLTSDLKDIKYIGYDIAQEAVTYGRKKLDQNLVCENYMESRTSEKFSDVFMWDVIEHLPDPDKFIQKISSESKAGGRLYITTGDIDSCVARTRKEKWRLIHPPTHLHYFSGKTISAMLEKNGFSIINISYPPIVRSFRFIFHSLFIVRRAPGSFLKKFYQWIPPQLYIPINMHDIMFVIARKK